MSDTVVYADIETDSVRIDAQITQLAAVAVDGAGRELGSFNELVQFDEHLADVAALELTKYDPVRWLDASPWKVVAERFARFLNPYKSIEMVSKAKGTKYKVARIGGFNSAVFDMPRLMAAFKRENVFLPAHPTTLDVYQLAIWYFEINPEGAPESLKLGVLCEHFGIELSNAHDALADVRATAALGRRLVGLFGERKYPKFA